MAPPHEQRRVLIVGAGIAGLAAARELRKRFRVTVVDPKEYFEFTSGILRAYAQPDHWDKLTFLYKEVLERNFGVRFIWGEVTDFDGQFAFVKTIFSDDVDVVEFDYCIIASGCNYNNKVESGESPWFPMVHERSRKESRHGHLDERFLEGRRRRILEEHRTLEATAERQGMVLVVGAGYYGVEWACELKHFFPGLGVTVCEWLPRCLMPLPESAAEYCEAYMKRQGIHTYYKVQYEERKKKFWKDVDLERGADKTYVLTGVRQSNFFMPSAALDEKRGSDPYKWIRNGTDLRVVTEDEKPWGNGNIFAVGDCTIGSWGTRENWVIPPLPKSAYVAEEQAVHACRNIRALDRMAYGRAGAGCCAPSTLRPTWYLWGAGIFTVSLGVEDGATIVGVTDQQNSGRLRYKGLLAVAQKELIQSTKMAQGRGDHRLASCIWHLVHHWPVNCWGRGPLCSC